MCDETGHVSYIHLDMWWDRDTQPRRHNMSPCQRVSPRGKYFAQHSRIKLMIKIITSIVQLFSLHHHWIDSKLFPPGVTVTPGLLVPAVIKGKWKLSPRSVSPDPLRLMIWLLVIDEIVCNWRGIFTEFVVDPDHHGQRGPQRHDPRHGVRPGSLAVLDLHPTVHVVSWNIKLPSGPHN